MRIYCTQVGRWSHAATAFAKSLANRHPSLSAEEHLHELESQNESETRFQRLAVRHMCELGPADLGGLEEYIGCALPPDISRFFQSFGECILFLRYPIRIFSPTAIVERESMLREAERKAGCFVPCEVTVLRFTQIEVFASAFALRKFQDGLWRVIIWGDETTEDLQNSADEQFSSAGVENFDEWLIRLLKSDGYPLDPAFPDFFRPPVAEREA